MNFVIIINLRDITLHDQSGNTFSAILFASSVYENKIHILVREEIEAP